HWSTGNGHLNSVQAGRSSAGVRAGMLYGAAGAASRPAPKTAARSATLIALPQLLSRSLRELTLAALIVATRNELQIVMNRPRPQCIRGFASQIDRRPRQSARRLFVVVVVADLGANLTGGEVRGVNIAVGGIGVEHRHQRIEITRVDVLRFGSDY